MKPAVLLAVLTITTACTGDRPLEPPAGSGEAPSAEARRAGKGPPGLRDRGTASVNVDFEGLSLAPGASVEGPGTVSPHLEIDALIGDALYIVEGAPPSGYGAPNDVALDNGCLGNPGGWTGPGTSEDGAGFASFDDGENFDFTFPYARAERFSIRMLDFGDLNTTLATRHRVVLTALDGGGAVVDADVLEFTTPPSFNPSSSDAFGDPQVTGDACTAAEGQPGNYVFELEGAGIARVTLRAEVGFDRSTAFDDVHFRLDCDRCRGGVTRLVMAYLGSAVSPVVEVRRLAPHRTERLPAAVDAAGNYVFGLISLGGQLEPVANGRMANHVQIFLNGEEHARLRTNCSQPLAPGVRLGDFEVLQAVSLEGGLACPAPGGR